MYFFIFITFSSLLNNLQFSNAKLAKLVMHSRCVYMQAILIISCKTSCLILTSYFLIVSSLFSPSSSFLEVVGIWRVADISENAAADAAL